MHGDVAAYICPVLLSLAFCAALPQQRQHPLVTASLSLTELRPTVKRATTVVAKPVVQGPSKVLVGSRVNVTCRVDVPMAFQNLYDVTWDVGSLSPSAYEVNHFKNSSSYFLVLTIHVTKADDLFNKTVLCVAQSPSGKLKVSWNPEIAAPPMTPTINGPTRPRRNMNITASCNSKGALGTKPNVQWLDIFNSNVTTRESSDLLVHVNPSSIPYWNVSAFLSLTLDNTLGTRSYRCRVTHPETNTVFTRDYAFTVVDDSNVTSEAQPGVLKEVLKATSQLQVPGLQKKLLEDKFALKARAQSKVQYMPLEMTFRTPDYYSNSTIAAIVFGVVFLVVLVVLGIATYLRRNSAPCYCC